MKAISRKRRESVQVLLFVIFSIFICGGPSHSEKGEETYSISLVKTAKVKEEIRQVGEKKVMARLHLVKEGDHVWQLLREKGLLRRHDLGEILSMLKRLNPSLKDLNLIHPGQKILIPLKIVPIAGAPIAPRVEEKTSIKALKEVKLEEYTVQPDDSLIKVIEGRYDIPEKLLYTQYLDLVKKLNPAIKDLDLIYPGQNIRLPIYSPKMVRKKIEPPSEVQGPLRTKKRKPHPLAHDLAQIFTAMGEEWVQTGEHFIPLRQKGQINLKADSFPIVHLRNGYKVVVDLNNELPENMAKLIESSWQTYRVVHLTKEDDLKNALGKILKQCHFQKLYTSGEPLELGGDIGLKIDGDYIILHSQGDSNREVEIVVLDLSSKGKGQIPWVLKKYLNGLGVKVIEYPLNEEKAFQWIQKAEAIRPEAGMSSLVKTLLDLLGQSFSSGVQIPVYQKKAGKFKLVIDADFYFHSKGKDCIIDVSGISPDMVSLLREHQFNVLTLSPDEEPQKLVGEVLKLLHVPFSPGPQSFQARGPKQFHNLLLTLPGVIFTGADKEPVFATPLNLPVELVTFLRGKGYRTLFLPH